MIRQQEVIEIGKIQKTHALKGELNMISDISPEYFTEGNPMILENDGILVPYYVESVRQKGSSSFLVKIEGIDSEDEASEFVNKKIYILKEGSEEWVPEDFEMEIGLIGYKIIDSESSNEIGVIKNIDDSTSNILFVIERGEDELLIPANEELIENIDDQLGIISMKIPHGLLDL